MSTRPRLLHLVTLSDWGGAQACVLSLARGFRDAFDVTVGCAPGGLLVERLRAEGIPVVEMPSLRRRPAPGADLAAFGQMLRVMHQGAFAIVHCHSTKAGLLGRIAARTARVPGIVFTAHGWPLAGERGAVRAASVLAERAVARITSAIICVAEALRQDALRLKIAGPEKLRVIYNGIDPSRWRAVRPRAESAERRPTTAIFVGRLQRQKDPQTLVAAWSRVPAPYRLEIVGDGPLKAEVERLIRRLDLGGRITLRGERDDVARRLRDADLLVLSSRWEGCPLVVIEAMMNGLPVVATDVGGVGELVDDGATGVLVPPGDPDALAAAAGRLLGDPALRARMGSAGQARALERFTEARMLAQTGAVYDEILRGQDREAPRP